MRLAVIFSGALLGLLAAQGTGNDYPHKKSATLLPSFTVTPTATESTTSPGTTSHRTTKSHKTTTHRATTKGPTTATHNPATTTSHGNVTVHPTSNSTATSQGPTTAATHNPTTTSHGNATVHPTSNSTATSPGLSTSSPHPGPPPPPPSPSPGSQEAIGNYTWTNGSQPCVQLHAQIQIRVLYPTQGGGEAWGISVLNPNKTKAEGDCEGPHPHLLLSFPYGQLSFGFQQDPQQSTVYLSYMAVEYNVSFPKAAQWTFSAQNSSLRDLQAPLGWSFSCRNSSIMLSPAFHLDLLSLRLQAAQLPHTGVFGPSFSCPSDRSILLPLIIGLILLGLLALVLVAFCIVRRRPPTYQPL
ncbi:PREDICTED: macrosialin [Propithecus coquereli]|uniref:Macrosialin n=1 Tax=Propithecus coquereli TaxID=379532 RepID=A0A2K6EGU7_PROCO|nr:PREDICTED: macrosialin [Propithecus coquereli]